LSFKKLTPEKAGFPWDRTRELSRTLPEDSVRCLAQGNREVFVYEAVTGETGLSVLKSVLPDVVVMEMKQPDMFGIEVLNLIKIQAPSIYVWTRLNNDVLRSAASLRGIKGMLVNREQ
jgi:DNA-binding NarL/FixJ family response regulator